VLLSSTQSALDVESLRGALETAWQHCRLLINRVIVFNPSMKANLASSRSTYFKSIDHFCECAYVHRKACTSGSMRSHWAVLRIGNAQLHVLQQLIALFI
jgi:hypothetical protein